MMKQEILILVLGFSLSGCHHEEAGSSINVDSLKQQIVKVETAFNQMAAEVGVKEAFLTFAAEDAVLVRGPGVIKGADAIEKYFNKQTFREVKLEWVPEFVDVSSGGDMAYTYGPYTFSAVDSTGETLSSEGIFHTVWKRQADGQWKFVYD